MNEQKDNGQEKEKQIQTKPAPKKKQKMSSERKFYLFTAIGCAAVLIAIIIVAIAVTGSGDVEQGAQNSSSYEDVFEPDDGEENQPTDGETPNENEPVVTVPEGMTLPIQAAALLNDYGFYHNTTLNNYYVHAGVDFAASVGAQVFAVDDGVVESIYKDDLLLGTEITVDHGEGVKSVYRFVTEVDGLTVGAKVNRGEVIATVAEATGNEYKDGAHLHFEILENGKSVDPTIYLTLEEK